MKTNYPIHRNNHRVSGGLVQPEATLFAQMLCGKYSFMSLAVFTSIMVVVPWKELYGNAFYKKFIDVVSIFYFGMARLENGSTQFLEYSMACLAFLGIAGPAFVVACFLYGFRHVKKIDTSLILSKSLVFRVAISSAVLLIFLIMLAYPVFWSGETVFTPGLFHSSKFGFLLFSILMWWVVALLGFVLSVLLASFSRTRD